MIDLTVARAKRLALASGIAGTAALGCAALAPAAQAAPFTCSATALSASLGGTALPLDQAFIPDGTCTTREGGIPSIPANPLLSGGALNANSQASGANASQVASAQGRVAGLDVGSLASLGIPLDTITSQIPIPSQLDQPITLALPAQAQTALQPIIATLTTIAGLPQLVPVPVPTGIPVLGSLTPANAQATLNQINAALSQGVTVNVGSAVRALLALPDTAVLHTGVASATATAKCVDNKAVLDGSSEVAAITALGQTLPTDSAATQVLTLNTAAIDLKNINLPGIELPALLNQLVPGLAATLTTTLQNQLIAQIQNALPAGGIAIPASALNLTVSPKSQDRTDTSLTQRGPRLTLNVAGQSVLDVTLGQASVGSTAVDCTTPVAPQQTPQQQQGGANSVGNGTGAAAAVAPSATQQLLQCSERRLVLTNVIQRSNRVALFGVADKAFAGQTVTIKFRASGQDVATATVLPDGTFKTTAPLPSAKVRGTNQARYQARIGTNTSLDLKLQRRMTVTNLDQKSGEVTVKGKLVSPLPTGGATVLISRRVSCNKLEPLKRVKADSDGNYEVTVPAPVAGSGVVYRLQSKVRNNPRNPKTYRTYTLPQGIDIAR